MKYSISESARIVGITRKTLYKHIDKKPISTEKDDNGRPVIDASELIRVYGDQCKFNLSETKKAAGQGIQASTQKATDVSNDGNVENAVTKKELELLRRQLTTDRDSFEEQIDYLRKKLDESTSESRKLTALITDQSKTTTSNDWQKSMLALEKRMADQESVAKEEKEKIAKLNVENVKLKNAIAEKERALKDERDALESEKSKGFFEKLFG